MIPFLGIPFSDVDVIKEAFGFKHQYIKILYGNYLGRAFKSEAVFHELLRPEIYKLYKSHTMSDGQSVDRPDLHLSRFGSIIWFCKRHFWHIALKIGAVFMAFYLVWYFATNAPGIISDSVKNGIQQNTQKNEKISNVDKSNKRDLKPVTSGKQGDSLVVHNSSLSIPPDERVYIIGINYIITDKGRKHVGDFVLQDGIKKRIKAIDFLRNTIVYDNPVLGLQNTDSKGT